MHSAGVYVQAAAAAGCCWTVKYAGEMTVVVVVGGVMGVCVCVMWMCVGLCV